MAIFSGWLVTCLVAVNSGAWEEVKEIFSPLSLADFDFVCFGCEIVLVVSAIAEWHEGGPAAPAPRLNNLPVDYDQVGTVLS